MELISIEYVGKKPYVDRTGLRNAWNPGDVKLVPEEDARRVLLRFAEFRVADDTKKADTKKAEVEAVQIKQKSVEQAKSKERDIQESVLMTVETMDKDALAAYAEKYEVKLDKRKNEASLRQEVTTLIEQFGAR